MKKEEFNRSLIVIEAALKTSATVENLQAFHDKALTMLQTIRTDFEAGKIILENCENNDKTNNPN